jgi:thiamine-monophosphate kinase
VYELIGRKALACSLSDCAGMACRPRGATVSLALNSAMRMEDVQALYAGMAVLSRAFECPLVGGDTTSWSGGLAIDVAVIAEPMSARGPVRRSTAEAGDVVYVSGPLGGSIRGRHLAFTPRLELAERLSEAAELHAMMDLSDGLSLDLHRLCVASGLRAELSGEQLDGVISDDARELSSEDGKPAIEHALSDGEDFELLVCGGAGLEQRCPELMAVGRLQAAGADSVGAMEIIGAGGRTSIEPRGFEHFR